MKNAAEEKKRPNVAAQDSMADSEALQRIEENLEQVEELLFSLDDVGEYDVPPLDYPLPAGFKLSIVVPIYNERKTLTTILSRVRALPLPLELILVDDYSTDGTRDLLARLASEAGIKVAYHERNRGKGAALRTGFALATGDIVIVQDADLEYDPRDIVRVIRPIVEREADVVYGSRFLRNPQQDPSFLHRFGNGLLTLASNLTTGLRLTDMETCYKAFRRQVIQAIDIKQNRFGFEPEVTAKIARRKHKIRELPIRYHARGYDEGKKIGIRDAINAFYCIARYALAD